MIAIDAAGGRSAGSRWRWYAPVAAVSLALLVRLPFLYWPLTIDEAAYAYTAHWWFRGVPLYGPDLWLDRFQGIMLAYQVGFWLLGGATWAIRLWAALWAAATGLAVYWLGRRLGDERAGLGASLLFALFSAAPSIEGFTANSELFMILPATLSACLLLARRPFWAGMAATLAVFQKPSGGVGFVLAALWLLYERARWQEWGRFALGALLPAAASAAHGAATVGLGPYAYAVALFELGPGWGPHRDVLPLAIRGWMASAAVWLPLAILAVPGVWTSQRKARTFVALWLLSSLAGVAMGGRWSPHYFHQIVPPLAVGAGLGLASLWERGRRARLWAVAVVLAFVLLFEGPYYLFQLARLPQWLGGDLEPQVSDQVADYLRAHTGEDETVYVAFNGARICYQAGRRSAYPYFFWVHILYYPGAYDRLVATIEAREPAYVLLFDPPFTMADPENRFQQALERGYVVERTFEGLPLYRRR